MGWEEAAPTSHWEDICQGVAGVLGTVNIYVCICESLLLTQHTAFSSVELVHVFVQLKSFFKNYILIMSCHTIYWRLLLYAFKPKLAWKPPGLDF